MTDRAGVFRSTFYLYFKDVYDVLEKIEQDIIDAWKGTVVQTSENGDIQLTAGAIVAFYRKYGDYMAVLMGGNGDPAFIVRFKDLIRPAVMSVLGFDEKNSLEEYKLEFLFSGTISAILLWYQSKEDIPLEDVLSFIAGLAHTASSYNNNIRISFNPSGHDESGGAVRAHCP